MTENIKIVNKTLTSGDSDVISSVVLPSAKKISDAQNVDTVSTIAGNDGTTYYYNYHAAMAYKDGVSVLEEVNPTTSICPKGWQIPDYSGSRSWKRLLEKGQGAYEFFNVLQEAPGNSGYVSESTFRALSNSPLNFSIDGEVVDKHLADISWATYWSRTTSGESYALRMVADMVDYTLHASSGMNGYKLYYRAVRCVAR